MKKEHVSVRERLNRYFCNSTRLGRNDLDFTFTAGKQKYRIKQFSWTWIAIYGVLAITSALFLYVIIVAMLIVGG